MCVCVRIAGCVSFIHVPQFLITSHPRDIVFYQVIEVDQRARRIELVRSCLREEEAKSNKRVEECYHNNDQRINNILNEHRQKEINRRSAVSVVRAREQRQSVRAWRTILRSLTNERGTWSAARQIGSTVTGDEKVE